MKLKFSLKLLTKVAATLGGVLLAGLAFADPSTTPLNGLTLTQIQGNMGTTVKHLAVVIQDISLIAGVGFVMASFFKFHQHKLNPTQVPMSQGVSLLLIGAALLLFPLLLPTATKAAFGTTAIAKTGGGAITGLISGN